MRNIWFILPMLALAACSDDYTPTPKTITYEPTTGELNYPHPCPDWSKDSETNDTNANHSNFGCAVNNNFGLQLDNPRDLMQGHGDNRPDTGISEHVIEQYRAGTLPKPLAPLGTDAGASESGTGGSSSGGSAQ